MTKVKLRPYIFGPIAGKSEPSTQKGAEMEESLKEILLKVADHLRFLGKYGESNAIIDLAVIAELRGCDFLRDLVKWREEEEKRPSN